jgi:hypothetical protein
MPASLCEYVSQGNPPMKTVDSSPVSAPLRPKLVPVIVTGQLAFD